jgi:hypothetical protein
MKKFETIEKLLAPVSVKHKELPERRSAALRTAMGDRKVRDMVLDLFGQNSEDMVRRFYSQYFRSKNPCCLPVHLCVVLERYLQVAEGAIYLALYHTEADNFRILKREYKLMAVPREIGPEDPVDVPADERKDTHSLSQERLRALQQAASAKGLTKARQIAIAAYPEKAQERKMWALEKRIARVLKSERMLTENDAVEIAPALGVASSVLIVRTDGPVNPQNTGGTRQDAAADTTVRLQAPAEQQNGQLSLSLSVEKLGVAGTRPLTIFDAETRTFRSKEDDAQVKIRRVGNRIFADISASTEIPPDQLGKLLEFFLH